jgi:hypothetical protein
MILLKDQGLDDDMIWDDTIDRLQDDTIDLSDVSG